MFKCFFILYWIFLSLSLSFGASNDCPLACFNQGTCKLDISTNRHFCSCPETASGGFQGVHCEIPFLQCTDGKQHGWKCLNGSHCQIGDDNTFCHCKDEFEGFQCATFTGGDLENEIQPKLKPQNLTKLPEPSKELSGAEIFGIIFASVAVLTIFFTVGIFIGYTKGKNQVTHEESTNIPGKSVDNEEVLPNDQEIIINLCCSLFTVTHNKLHII